MGGIVNRIARQSFFRRLAGRRPECSSLLLGSERKSWGLELLCEKGRFVASRVSFPTFTLLSAFQFLGGSQKPIRPEHRTQGLGRVPGEEVGDDLAGGWGEAEAEHGVAGGDGEIGVVR